MQDNKVLVGDAVAASRASTRWAKVLQDEKKGHDPEVQ